MKATNPDLVGGDDDISPDDDSSAGSDGWSDEDDDAASDNAAAPKEQDDDDDELSLAEGSDADDLIDLDDDVPDGLIEYPGSESGEGEDEGGDEEWTGFGGDAGTKRKRGEKQDDGKKKKKKLRSLPTFASYEDYAKMIEEGPEDDI